jgi:hypothetical protein
MVGHAILLHENGVPLDRADIADQAFKCCAILLRQRGKAIELPGQGADGAALRPR